MRVHNTSSEPHSITAIKNGMLAFKYKGLHRAQSILNNAIHHWKWPVETSTDTDQLEVDHAYESQQLQMQHSGLDEELDGFDSDSSF